MRRTYFFDIETYTNCFSLVAKDKDTGEYLNFIIYEDDELNKLEDLLLWLSEDPKLIGYNSLGFDAQIIEYIWDDKRTDKSARAIYKFVQDEIINNKDRFKTPYSQWKLKFTHLDLMLINNFGIYGKPTSLKWLEFTTRQKSIQDLPKSHTEELTHKDFDKLLRYNRKDVDMTGAFFWLCEDMIEMRNVLKKKYQDPMIMNQPNSAIGAKIVLNSYCDYTGSNKSTIKNKSTSRKLIKISEIILPYVKFSLPLFKEVKKDFDNLVLRANKDGVINLKGVYEKQIHFQNMDVKYALGGIHGCVPSGIYASSNTHIIKTYDVTSMYPNIAIANKFYPEHLGEEFCEVYKNILIERKKYEKGTELNLAFKEAANSVYGKSNAKFGGFLKDPRYTVQTTINGQLVLSMLAEQLSKLGEFIMLNTDGSEILIRRDKEDEYNRICDEWCKMTGIELEHDEYDTMWIRDVNNYIARFTSGKVKRKGFLATYEDYKGWWSKNPSALIIPEAINAYFLENKDPHDTITNWENIHDFCYGIKGGSAFEYWLFDIKENVILDIDKRSERAIRYYSSTDGGSIMKFYRSGKKDGNLESVPNTKGQMVKLLMNTRDNKGNIFRTVKDDAGNKVQESRYPDLDYNYYVAESWKWINIIEGELK